MKKSNWDIFANENAPGSFWAAAQIAHQLGSNGEIARIFAGGVQSAWPRSASCFDAIKDKDRSVEVLDISRSYSEPPASRAIEIWGAQAPAVYLERLAHYDRHCCFVLDSPNSFRVSLTPLSPVSHTDSCKKVALQMGCKPRHAGYLKYGRNILRSRRLSVLYKDRLALLAKFDVSTASQQSAYFVMMSGETAFDPCPVVRMLRDTLRPTVLLVEPGSAQLSLACAFSVPFIAGGYLQLDQLTLVFLPEMSWQEQDDCIILSDLVISSEASLCWRACCLGTPLVCGFSDYDQGSLLEWYCQGSISAPHVLLKNLSSKLLKYVDLAEAWHWYWSCLPDFEDHAHEIQQRILDGPDLIETLLAASSMKDECTSGAAPERA